MASEKQIRGVYSRRAFLAVLLRERNFSVGIAVLSNGRQQACCAQKKCCAGGLRREKHNAGSVLAVGDINAERRLNALDSVVYYMYAYIETFCLRRP